MIFRRLPLIAIAIISVFDVAHAGQDGILASFRPRTTTQPLDVGLSAYRLYVNAQADTLVGMTRLLASEIKDGNVEAAQSAYGPAHRYFARLAPVAATFQDLAKRMDARADDYEKKKADAHFAGFHRIEHGLFANKSTADLSADADQLYRDSRELREQIKRLDIDPGKIIDAAADLVNKVAVRKLDGGEERYSRTDLWDVEANLDGVHQIVTLLPPPQSQNTIQFAQTEIHFAKINALLEKHKAGCGFKSYDELSQDDKAALKEAVTALSVVLSAVRATMAMD